MILDDEHGDSFRDAGIADRWITTMMSRGLTAEDAARATSLMTMQAYDPTL